ncbi:hypothetical protein EV694_1977 [Volucribacter psittacicida]|uniref:HTH cro/C1-type domain-containing protein n=1 Tax=Volucribacter psittacicida TaxID=203482 RepID=A0A4R1FQZ6_9PAST|nr:helix-turn-helix transcriptional regulator [Volucribacter psittacicida]TCJ95974.1 hypothetical protein EV694_1977 [Volucribacter psittacicida]
MKRVKLTEFGKAVRKARVDANETLYSMAKAIGTSPSFLSGMETGRKKITVKWVVKIVVFFQERNIQTDNFQMLAEVSNHAISVKGLPLQQQILIAELAKSVMTIEQLKTLAILVKQVNQGV